ncbi:MAG: hypothetical protein KDA65_10585 [Planctomycetaceae bacterium]|nr:hypothetical protein [Planctomycetaceae bacterium]
MNSTGGQPILSIPPTETEKANLTRTIQVIVMALIMGAISFTAVICFLTFSEANLVTEPADLFFLMPLCFSAFAITGWFFFPILITKATLSGIKNLDRDTQESRLWGFFQTKTIISSALLEGASFFTVLMFKMSENLLDLYLVIVLLFLLIISVPTRFKIDNWVEDKLSQLEMMN